MAFGSWGGQGPEAAKLLARAVKRALHGCEPHLQAGRKHEILSAFGLALMKGTFDLLLNKAFLR